MVTIGAEWIAEEGRGHALVASPRLVIGTADQLKRDCNKSTPAKAS